jgi:hypothetical protein
LPINFVLLFFFFNTIKKNLKMSKYSNVTIEQIPQEKLDDAMAVRIAVFVHEQKYELETEYDG